MLPRNGNFRVAAYARIVVCEKGGGWAVALRRLLGETGRNVVETRSLEECWKELDESPASFVALELLPGNVEAVMKRLLDVSRHFPHARAVVLAERRFKSYQWVLREAGAVHAVFSLRSLPTAARLIDRHMQSVSEPAITFCQSVWRRLPWSRRGAAW